jgi:NTE family protein
VLAGLEERGVDVDLIVGIGLGSLLGAAYAIGLPIQSLERLGVTFQTPLEDILAPRPPRRADVARGRRLRHLLRTLFGRTPLESLHVPLWVVATDADTGDEVVLRSGPLASALEASLGLRQETPGHVGRGRPLLDSSVVNPVPVRLAREMGADIVVAVATSPRPSITATEPRGGLSRGRRGSPQELAMQTLRLAAHRLAALSVETADVVIAPSGSGDRGRALYQRGRLAAVQAASRIAALQTARSGRPVAR